MNNKAKISILKYLISFIIFLLVWGILDFTFKDLASLYKGMISATITFVLSPKIRQYKTQSGKQIQMKWIFLKKAINI